jgi:hypothetical protein
MSEPPLYETTRRSYEEKRALLVDLAMLLFGGLLRLLKRRVGQ